MRRLFYIAALLTALGLPVSTMAQRVEVDNIFYHIVGDHAEVSPGSYPYSGEVAIPASIALDGTDYPVTAIEAAAFRDCPSLTSVTIPPTVTTVGEYAFAGCTSLDSVGISDLAAWCSIEFYSESANPCYQAHRLFVDGEEVVELVVPEAVTTIGSFAFAGCSSLTSVTIPATVTEIGASPFIDCGALTAMTVASDNPYYDSRDSCNAIIWTATSTLVSGCQITVIPTTVTAIGNWAFYSCTGLTSILIPNSVTEIGVESFSHCSSLMGVNIPNSVSMIGYQAFYGCTSLRSIHLPASVRGIGSSAFEFCPSLTSMSVAPDNPRFDSRDECNAIIVTDGNTLLAGCRNTVIPSTVTAIDDYAFSGSTTLTGIEIPASVTTVGDFAFRNCSALRSVVIPEGVTSIGASAFFECAALNRVEIPTSVVSIGSFAFEHCPAITSMTVARDNPAYDSRDSCNAIIETATSVLKAGCMNTIIPTTVTAIGDNAFSGSFMLTKVAVPPSVTAIGHYAFAGCTSLSSINIPNTVTAIGDAAFSGCSALTALDIPNSVVHIGQAAFGGCQSLERITLPKSVTAIGDYEFYGCTMLKEISLPKTVTAIGTAAFRGCISLTDVTIPRTVTAIGSSAFRECPSITSMTVAKGNPVYDSREGCNAIIETATGTLIAGCRNTVIPTTVTAIGNVAFDGCVLLDAITIPEGVTTIGRKAFSNCPALSDVTSRIADPTQVTTAPDAFKLPSGDYSGRTLHVPAGTAAAYQSTTAWQSCFDTIDEQ